MDYTKTELLNILKKSDWYLQLQPLLIKYSKQSQFESEEEKANHHQKREQFIRDFSEALQNGDIALGNGNEFQFDSQRKPIDTVVIHHSSREPEVPLSVINAIHLINLYVPEFSNPDKKQLFGKPISSGHFKDNKMTFFGYHYVVMPDGEIIQNLKDDYIGWHCGNWDYNCRSIAICFHADLEESEPTNEAIESARNIISKYNPKEILGHCEIKPSTICPGNKFLGATGWKNKLIQ